MASDALINAVITFFAGVGVILGIVILVYTLAHVADKLSCINIATLTAEEMEQRRIASSMLRDAGLAGLLSEERVRVYRAFFEKRSFPYCKPDDDEKPDEDQWDENPKLQKLSTASKETEDDKTEDDNVDDSASGESQENVETVVDENPNEDANDTELEVSKIKVCDCGTNGDEVESGAPACSICLNEYEDGENVIIGTACSHMFHYSCFMQWVDKGNEHCPYCREHMISPDNFNETAREVLGEERVEKLMKVNEEAAVRVAEMMASGAHVSTSNSPISSAVPTPSTEAMTGDQPADPETRTVAPGDAQGVDEEVAAETDTEDANLEEGMVPESNSETSQKSKENTLAQEQPEEMAEETSTDPVDAGTDLEAGTTPSAVSDDVATEEAKEEDKK